MDVANQLSGFAYFFIALQQGYSPRHPAYQRYRGWVRSNHHFGNQNVRVFNESGGGQQRQHHQKNDRDAPPHQPMRHL
ncbi:MAG: hypothetical protein ACK5OO_14015, partial [Cyclobacteriaceae bacterium]